MNRTLRAKLVAGAGVAAIITGGLLALTPTFAGAASVEPILNPDTPGEPDNDNPSCSDLGYTIEAKYNSSGDPGDSNTADSGNDPDLVVDWTFQDDGTIDFVVDETSDYLVKAAVVKQGSAESGGGANVYIYNPAVASDTELVDPKGDEQFSHITFCSDGSLNTTTTTEEVTTTDEVTTTGEETTTTAEETTTTVEETTTTAEETTTTVEETTTTVEETTTTVEETTTTVEETTTTVEETTTTEGISTTVLGDEETTTTESEVDGESTTTAAQGATTTEGPEVLPSQIALPQTGSGADRLAAIGIGLMIFGAVLVGGSRRSLLPRD